ncbi:AarF/ABC1/UbiB kinase family protein [Paraglaciecola sp. MB-3u-78]|uniref:ABC1 kinase family protein n=1 Tax=Paraglaciecola sp. MB-3u-78 TaxID=2058332 RepID=UPI000C339644|nr:AarF/UbiB family protein [Paraglaciecola sp. MB-3u-78]PKG96663.1 kinase [Paraglaciecola sp. MB-3u-78]
MGFLPDIHSIVKRNISLTEMGVRSSLRLTQTMAKVTPYAIRWGLKRKLPPANEVRQLFEALGTTYIKFGQFIASSPSIFPKEYVEEFEQLLDQSTPIPFRTIKKIISEDLKQPINRVFCHIDQQPLASASIAQVHAATLVTGEDVVVKVQKPGVQAIITADLNTVYVLVRLLELMLPNTDSDALAGIVSEMYQAMIDECDFTKEAQHIKAFRHFIDTSNIKTVVAPKVYAEASGLRVLTMERFYGCALTDKNAKDKSQGDPAKALFEALNVWFASLMHCEVFHGDLHSGNMMLFADGRVGFIDFGMVGRVSPETWQAMFSLFKGLNEQDYALVAHSMLAVGMTRKSIDERQLSREIEQVFLSMKKLDSEDLMANDSLNVSPAVNDVINTLGEVARNHGIRFPRSFTLLLKQFLYFDRYIQILDPDANLFDDERIHLDF